MSALEQMKNAATAGAEESATGELEIATVGSKLKPILTKRAAEVAKTIADFNRAEDEFITKKLGASNLKTSESTLDVSGLFATL